jgi:hypothetical protein
LQLGRFLFRDHSRHFFTVPRIASPQHSHRIQNPHLPKSKYGGPEIAMELCQRHGQASNRRILIRPTRPRLLEALAGFPFLSLALQVRVGFSEGTCVLFLRAGMVHMAALRGAGHTQP